MTEREPTQFAFRALRETGVCRAPPASAQLTLDSQPAEEVKALKYSPNGKYLAWAVSSQVQVVDAQTLKTQATIAHPGVLDVRFSPNGTYLVTWERYTKKAGAEASRNLCVWDAASGDLKGSFTQQSFSPTALQWTDDEKYCAKLFQGEVRFYAPEALARAALTLKLDGVTSFSLSPGMSPSVAVFVPERGSKPALVRMYPVGSFVRATSNKTFFKADKVEFYWHHLGTNLLVLTQTEVDNTGRSYYGESSLYFMAAAGTFDCRVVLDRDGPIHDVAWSPSEKEFVVSYGFMPAKTALFNHRAEPVFDFGTAPRNSVKFNPHGRVLAVGGFGNLSGMVDLWDRKKLKKICTIDAHGASLCDWSPDGRYLLAATLSPRLRVDNGIRIWHYSGTLVYRRSINELFHVDWRPAAVAHYPQRASLSPVPAGIAVPEAEPKEASAAAAAGASGASPAAKKPAGAYRPPHARNRPSPADSESPRSLSDMAERKVFGAAGGRRAVPGATPKVPVGAGPEMAAKANEKKRNRKKARDTAAEQPPAPSDRPQPVAPNPVHTEADALKRMRMLKKKIGQIEALATRRDAGESLEINQLAKIESRPQIEAEIADLTKRFSELAAPGAA
ncbi:hypothetical protein GGF46_002738 [Coemansia sp. RSA 552]|nr:hypothetical protein GGF46_002738 [Coemansia sp. RSA 552]